MLKEIGFYKGVNLGGWFSQCDYSKERLDSFITERTLRRSPPGALTMCASPSTIT